MAVTIQSSSWRSGDYFRIFTPRVSPPEKLLRLVDIPKDSFTDVGSAFGLKSYSAIGGLLDLMRKPLASDQGLSECRRRIQTGRTTGQTKTTALRSLRRGKSLQVKSLQVTNADLFE